MIPSMRPMLSRAWLQHASKQTTSLTQVRYFGKKSNGEPGVKYHKPLRTKRHGIEILHDPLWNKSLAFDVHERDRLGLRGLLPSVVRSLEGQVERTIGHIRRLPDNVAKNLYLQELHNRNETLYHRVLLDYIDEIAPLVYTPTVGVVCQQFGHRFNRSRGMYFSVPDRGMFSTMVHNWPHDDVHVIVVTDGSRILGLGDLGAHGMGIPIGKLALYCAAGGIAPHRVLPIMLDVGTNNKALLDDPDYIGVQKPRLEGDEYFEFLEEFMQAVFSRWPGVVVQFEDFETAKAVPLLQKYRHKYRCFNDDIQGTGCVTLAGVLSATKIAGRSFTDSRILCAGMGSAGLGVCTALYDGLVAAGLSPEEARSRFVLCSVDGAFGKADGSRGDPHHQKLNTFVKEALDWRNDAVSDGMSMLEAVQTFRPNIILGLSAQGGIFTEQMLATMNAQCTDSRPIVMPMSNPTAKAECTAEQAYRWTQGRAVVATGSPFPPTTLPDGRVLHASQCNNMYIFPGIGLAASVAGISTITDNMLYVAALACADSTTHEDIAQGRVFPDIRRIREVSLKVAVKVIEEGVREGLATKIKKHHHVEGIENLVKRKMYYPTYVPLL